jgi:hypothetical protein
MATLIPKYTQVTTANRTIAQKFAETISVKDYGATGDGTTDDTAAIQAAINASYQFSGTFPGLSKGKIYFPPGVYLISSTLNASSIGAMYGESKHECVIKYSGASTTVTCNSGIQINELAFLGTGTQTALNFPTLAYLSQIINNSFYNFTTAINYANTSNSTSVNTIELNTFVACTTGLAFAGTVTTTYIVGNQFNTGTTCISAGNMFSTQILNNVFEDIQTAFIIPSSGASSYGLIAGNWFERTSASGFANIIPYQDNTPAPGYFAYNTFSGNRYVNAGTYTYGTNSVVTESGNVTLTPTNVLGYANGLSYSITGITPTSTACAASTTPFSYTVRTQDAVSTATSPGGDFIFRAGLGSNSARYGAFRPYTDNVSNIGDASYRWATVYAGTGTINTSDANLKQNIELLNDKELAVAKAIKSLIKKFKFKDAVQVKNDKARIHVGVIAQEVKSAFEAEGFDAKDYALFCSDTLEDGSERLGIRYDELLAFVIASL